ncbi:MAG: hypothetical protein ABSH48_25770 [Verrucomicrobiota bacterium]|jgi:hypothetical protein
MKTVQFAKILSVLFSLWLPSSDAHADGGMIRFREIQGPFVITIFTAPELVQDCPADVSILVLGRDSSDVILNARVKLVFTAPAASAMRAIEPRSDICSMTLLNGTSATNKTQFTVVATRQQASNKLLYAAPVKFGTAGNWRLQAFIERGSDAVKIACDVPVGSPPHRFTSLFPYLVLPPIMVVLFAINQFLRTRSFDKDTELQNHDAVQKLHR